METLQTAPANGAAAPYGLASPAAPTGKRKRGPTTSEPMTVSRAVGRIESVLRQLPQADDRIAALGVALADAKRALGRPASAPAASA